MRAFGGLLRKEVLAFMTNRTFVVLVGLPVLVAVLFNLAFSGERPVATVAFVPPSDGALAERARHELDALPTLRLALVTGDPDVAMDAAIRGRVSAVVDARALRTEGDRVSGRIALIVDELRPVSAQVVESTIAAWGQRLGGARPSVSLELSAVRGVSSRDATTPLWLVVITLVVAISSVPLGLIEERELKTIRALLLAPVGRAHVLAAKGVIALLTILAMCLLVVILNGVSVCDPGLLALALVAGAVAFVPVGLALGAFSPNQTAFGPVGGLLLVALLLPVALAQGEAGTVGAVAQALPSGALAALVRAAVLTNMGAAQFLAQLAYLGVVGVVSSLVAVWAIGRESVMTA